MNKIQRIYLMLFIVLLAIIGFYTFFHAHESKHEEDELEQAEGEYQAGTVYIGIAAQRAAGIQTRRAVQADYQPEHGGVGYVLPVDDLMAIYEQLSATRHALNLSNNALKASTNELQRVVLLNKEHSHTTARRYDEAKRQYQEDFMQSKNLEQQIKATRNTLQRQWGERIAGWFFAEDPQPLTAVLNGERLLVDITLDDEVSGAMGLSSAFIHDSADRATAIPASYVSRSIHAKTASQRESHLFSVQAGRLKAGMRVYAWVAAGQPVPGVIVEANAVIWHEDKPWLYIKTGADVFNRMELQDYYKTGSGWFVANQALVNLDYVFKGAQILLSEEFRWRIPDEDDVP